MIASVAPMGHRTTGAYRIVMWGRSVEAGGDGVTAFVARSAAPGKRWLRFLRKIGNPLEWHVTSRRTLAEAVRG